MEYGNKIYNTNLSHLMLSLRLFGDFWRLLLSLLTFFEHYFYFFISIYHTEKNWVRLLATFLLSLCYHLIFDVQKM